MAQDDWPSPAHNSRDVTDLEYEKIAARFSDDGINGSSADTAVVSAGAGLQVIVRSGVYGSLRGHAWTSGTTNVTLSVGSNTSGSTRTDRVVLRLDRSTWTVRAVVRAGTPGAGAPNVQQDLGDTGLFEIPLALVTVVNNATSVTVARDEQYIGSRIRSARSGAMPINSPPGEITFQTDTAGWWGWDGTNRVLIWEDTGDVTLGAGFDTWSNETPPIGRRVGRVVTLDINVKRISSTFSANDADGSKLCTVPVQLRPTGRPKRFCGQFTTGATCRVEVRTNGDVYALYPSSDVPVNKNLALTMTYLWY